jgi:hypothetical protein
LGRRVSSLPAETPTLDGMAAPINGTNLTEYC